MGMGWSEIVASDDRSDRSDRSIPTFPPLRQSNLRKTYWLIEAFALFYREIAMRAARIFAIALVVSGVSVVDSQAQTRGVIEGDWRLEETRWDDEVQLRVRYRSGRHGSADMGFTIALDQLNGIDEDDVERRERTDVRFELARDAGTVVFEGDMRRGAGRGDFVFTPNEGFVDDMSDLGFRRLRDEEVLQMALHDVNTRTVSELRELGYTRISTDQLFSVAIFDVTPEYIREMRDAGQDDLRLDELVQFRIFDVDPMFIEEMSQAGFDRLSADELVQAKIHGVTPEYAREMRGSEGRRVGFDELVQGRIFSVDPEFMNDMEDLGLDLDFDEAVQFQIHGVTKAFARGMMGLDIGRIVAQDLVQMRIHGVTMDWVEDMMEEFDDLDVDDLVDMRIHGSRNRDYDYRDRRSRRGRTR